MSDYPKAITVKLWRLAPKTEVHDGRLIYLEACPPPDATVIVNVPSREEFWDVVEEATIQSDFEPQWRSVS